MENIGNLFKLISCKRYVHEHLTFEVERDLCTRINENMWTNDPFQHAIVSVSDTISDPHWRPLSTLESSDMMENGPPIVQSLEELIGRQASYMRSYFRLHVYMKFSKGMQKRLNDFLDDRNVPIRTAFFSIRDQIGVPREQ